MDSLGDVRLHIPAEHFDDLSQVIEAGLQRAKISQEARKNLASWWEAEKSMIVEDIVFKSQTEI
jgi:hypothetical protein